MPSPQITACFALVTRLVLASVLFVGVSSAETAAQTETTPKASETVSDEIVALGELPQEIEKTRSALRDADGSNAPSSEVEQVRQDLPALAKKIRDRARTSRDLLRDHPSVEVLADVEKEWLGFDATVKSWTDLLGRRAKSLSDALSRVRALDRRWRLIEKQVQAEKVPEATLEQIRGVRSEIAEIQRRIEARRDQTLTLQGKVVDVTQDVSSILVGIRDERSAGVSRLFTRDTRDDSGLWNPSLWERDLEDLPKTLRSEISDDLATSTAYLHAHRRQVALEGLGLSFLVWLLIHARGRVAEWKRDDPQVRVIARVLERPVSAALLLAVIALPWLHPKAPSLLSAGVQGLALLPALRILLPLFGPGLRPALLVLAGFYLVDQLRHAAVGVPLVPYLLFVTEMGAGAAFMFLLLRPARLRSLPPRAGRELRFRWTGRGLRLLRAAFGLSLVSALSGYVELAVLVGSGALRSAYLAAVLYAAFLTLQGLFAFLLRVPFFGHLRAVRHHRALLERRSASVLSVAAVVFWMIATLDFISLRDALQSRIIDTLTAPIEVGNLSFSLGGVLLFAAIIWLSFQISRFLRFVLDEEVYDRVSLTRGVPYAISTLTHYGILLTGSLLAILSLGVNLDRFALIAGALGVGVGFGLQNVVNNFVSGLILLFERPIQVGDSVQIGELRGDVRRIGIRSSTLRTWEGAEVIVPNASLVSDQVTNWTLSDRLRRIDVAVGVAYGNDPDRVIEVLIEVARAHPQILADPAPEVVFVGFGDSSLDFQIRAWTGDFFRWITISSELTIATSHALRDAGIEIPFPQRDLHVRSVDLKNEEARESDRSLRGREPRDH